MSPATPKTRTVAVLVGITALVFGVVTIAAGGRALFGGDAARASVGNAVPFVLWFNFGAGFVYLLAGAGVLRRRRWAVWLSALIATATVLVFLALGVHIFLGGAYEMRTVGAMALRSLVWIGIVIVAHKTAGI